MTKIEAIEKTIYNLENDVYRYSWYHFNSCNCGTLARTLLDGKTPEQCGFLDSPAVGLYGAFSKEAFCIETNLPLPQVFEVLKNTGFTYKELHRLEYLSDEDIVRRAKLPFRKQEDDWESYCPDYKIKQSLIKYLKAWVEILQEQHKAAVSPVEKTRIVYVSVPETITAQTKELITN